MDPEVLMQLTQKYAVLASIVVAFTELLKRALIPEKHRARVVPVISVLLGIGGAYLMVGFTTQAAFVGLVIGLIACGLWSGGKNVIKGNTGAARLMAVILLLAFITVGLAGCATTPSGDKALDPVKSRDKLYQVREIGTAVFVIADDSCAVGLLDQRECDRAGEIYLDFQKTYALAADSLSTAVESASGHDAEAYRGDFLDLFLDMAGLAAEFGLLDGHPDLKAKVEELSRYSRNALAAEGRY